MAKSPPPIPMPPLLPNEVARKWEGRVEVRGEPVRARWSFTDAVTSDGHRLRCAFACTLRPLPDAAERKLLGEVFLGHKSSATVDDLIAHFAPTLGSTASNVALTRTVTEWLADGAKTELSEALRKAADKVAFACGLELAPPFNVDLESPSFQQQKLEAMERNLAEQRVAGQVEHFERAAGMLKQFDTLRQAAPGITPGAVLQQISPTEQGMMLQTLLLAAGKERASKALWAVAGPYLVRVDAHASPPKTELVTLPGTLGPLRSVQPGEIEGRPVLLVGARSGVLVFDPDKPNETQAYQDPDTTSQMGFSRALVWRNGVWACHGEAGVIGWDLGSPEHPKTILRPAHLAPAAPPIAAPSSTSIEITKPGSPRNLVGIDDARLMFSIGERLLTIDADGKLTALPVDSRSEVIAILPDRKSVYVVRENGSVATHEITTLAVSSEERRGGHVCAATVLPWLGSVRLLLAMEDGPIQCLGTEDQLVTQYLSPHRGLRMLAAASDWVLAVSADRQRVVMWNSWDGKKPAADVSIAAIAKHRIADVDFG